MRSLLLGLTILAEIQGAQPFVVHGHRGAPALRPENTLPSFQEGTVVSGVGVGWLVQNRGWDAGFQLFIAASDLVCPTDEPTVLVDCGAICACLAAATGRRPVVLGKPSPDVLLQICRSHGLRPQQVAMVGDRLYTDVAMARGAGCISVLVLTGEATREQACATDSPPDLIVADVGALGGLLEAAR